jgi:alpha-glucoside transport system permease protein
VGSGQSITVAPPQEAPPPPDRIGRRRRAGTVGLFLLPAALLIGVWIVYPLIATIIRSFYDASGDRFVGLDNYQTLFTSDPLQTAIRNNVIWVAVVPAMVTAIGLVFAVLIEKVRWSTAFKIAIFMPMAISLFAAGVIWRVMYEKEPDRGALNASIAVVKDWVDPPGTLSRALPSSPAVTGNPQGGIVLREPVSAGDVAPLGLTGIRADEVPQAAQPAVRPEPEPGAITGVVWRDFRPGGGRPGVVEEGEAGLPGVTVELRGPDGGRVASTTTRDDGTFVFGGVEGGPYRVAIGSATFAAPFGGVDWLGADLITPSVIIAYIWVWAGFAMVLIAAGLSAIPRDLQEAARTDGANEWQVFRRVTVPLLAPVLSVVFITMIINVLKVFDIVLSVAPASVQNEANVIALALWRTAFSGTNDFGLGSAIAVFLFLLVIPVLLLNVRRFRREA